MDYILLNNKNFRNASPHIYMLLCGADKISDIVPSDYAAWLEKLVLGVIQGTRNYALAVSDGKTLGFLQWSGIEEISIENMVINSDDMAIGLLRVLAESNHNIDCLISNIPNINNLSNSMTVKQLLIALSC